MPGRIHRLSDTPPGRHRAALFMQSVETFRKGHDPMGRPRPAAGRRLVDSMHEALARTSAETGRTLVWSEQEEAALERAGETVGRAEKVGKLLDSALKADEPNPLVVVKLSAE